MNFEKYKMKMVEPIIGQPNVKYEIYGIEDVDTGNNIPIPYIHTKPYAEILIEQLNIAYSEGYETGQEDGYRECEADIDIKEIFEEEKNNNGIIHPPKTDSPRPKPPPNPEYLEKQREK